MKSYEGKTIWIIGASSGIGWALAKELHRLGAFVILSARDEEALEELSQQLGSRLSIAPLDVRNIEAIKECFDRIGKQTDIDSVVFMAGIYKPLKISEIKPAEISDMLATNLQGAMLVVRQVLPYFLSRKKGQIALCASVAGYRGLPNAQPYGATKAALINFTETLRIECANTGVDIKLINPGFVKTRLTDQNAFTMPSIISSEQAAKFIADGLQKKNFEICFPKKFTFAMKALALLPYSLYFRLMAR